MDYKNEKIVHMINGFEIKTRLEGTPQQYYTAKRGDEVFTSKDLNYIKRKVNSRAFISNQTLIKKYDNESFR